MVRKENCFSQQNSTILLVISVLKMSAWDAFVHGDLLYTLHDWVCVCDRAFPKALLSFFHFCTPPRKFPKHIMWQQVSAQVEAEQNWTVINTEAVYPFNPIRTSDVPFLFIASWYSHLQMEMFCSYIKYFKSVSSLERPYFRTVTIHTPWVKR